MATSSIAKNFIISGQKQVEMFADAIENSANNRPVRTRLLSDFSCPKNPDKYMIIRRRFEEYMDNMAGKNTVELVELCIVNVPHE